MRADAAPSRFVQRRRAECRAHSPQNGSQSDDAKSKLDDTSLGPNLEQTMTDPIERERRRERYKNHGRALDTVVWGWHLTIQVVLWIPLAVCFAAPLISWIFGINLLFSMAIAFVAASIALFIYRSRT